MKNFILKLYLFQEVNLKMPPFKVTSKIKMKQLFTETAELNLITDNKPIGISDIFHKCVFEATINGTEGALATGIRKTYFLDSTNVIQ